MQMTGAATETTPLRGFVGPPAPRLKPRDFSLPSPSFQEHSLRLPSSSSGHSPRSFHFDDQHKDYYGPERGGIAGFLDSFFDVSARGSTLSTEIRSGVTMFFTMAYIVAVNAEILHHAGMPRQAVMTATVLSSALGCFIAGVAGNLPFGLAPGMGLNSYFAFGVCLRLGLTWGTALACCFAMGVLFLLLSLTGVCTAIQSHAPDCIKKGITVGLGFFQALIGLEAMHLIVRGKETLLQTGDVTSAPVLLASLGLLVTCLCLVLRVNAAMAAGIVATTAAAWATGAAPLPESLAAAPTLAPIAFAIDFHGFFANLTATLPVTLILLFVAVFDTAGVHYALGLQSGLLRGGRLAGSGAAFAAAAVSTIAGAGLGTSPVIIHTETGAGIQEGARTGLSAVVCGLTFLLILPLAPLVAAIPSYATAGPLVVVGMLMMSAVRFIEWTKLEEAFPAFITITVLPLTYSIANGMGAGVVAYALLKPAALWADKRAARAEAAAATAAAEAAIVAAAAAEASFAALRGGAAVVGGEAGAGASASVVAAAAAAAAAAEAAAEAARSPSSERRQEDMARLSPFLGGGDIQATTRGQQARSTVKEILEHKRATVAPLGMEEGETASPLTRAHSRALRGAEEDEKWERVGVFCDV